MSRLACGDCLEKMKMIKDGSIDMVLVDPPYGITACKWDSVIPLELMWSQLKRITKSNSAILIFGSEPFSSTLRMSNPTMFRYDWYWHKNRPSGGMSAKKRPMNAIEIISVFFLRQPTYKPIMVPRTELELKRFAYESVYTSCTPVDGRKWNKSPNREEHKLRHPSNVLLGIKTVFNRSKEKVAHPTQKPIALMEYMIKSYTNKGDTVLDFAMGSGTTGVACKRLGMNFIGIEIDEEYFAIAKERILNAKKIEPVGLGL